MAKKQALPIAPASPSKARIPYEPHHSSVGGVYRITIGRQFFIGSARKLGAHRSDHQIKLEAGNHPNRALQLAFDECDELRFEITNLLPEKPHEPAADYRKRRQMWEQIELNAWFGTKGCLNTRPDSGFNTTIDSVLKRKWQDDAWRDAQMARLRARKGDAVSAESRARMSEAKRGSRNLNSRKCRVGMLGSMKTFETATDAAREFGVSQQVMDLWLRGVVAWPGTGRKSRNYGHLEGLTGAYLQ